MLKSGSVAFEEIETMNLDHICEFLLETDGPSCEIDLRNISSCVTELSDEINAVKEIARVMNIPCDGAVITFLDEC